MPQVRSFLDNLKNLRLVTSVALEHIHANLNDFVRHATAEDLDEFDRYITHLRGFAEQLEREFNTIEYLLSKRPPN